jgi:hypothetical protein
MCNSYLFMKFSREKSAVSHSIIWSRPLTAKRVEIDGATAYSVDGLFLLLIIWC